MTHQIGNVNAADHKKRFWVKVRQIFSDCPKMSWVNSVQVLCFPRWTRVAELIDTRIHRPKVQAKVARSMIDQRTAQVRRV